MKTVSSVDDNAASLLNRKFTFALSEGLHTRLHDRAHQINLSPAAVIRAALEKELDPSLAPPLDLPANAVLVPDAMNSLLRQVASMLSIPLDSIVHEMILSGLPAWMEKSRHHQDSLMNELRQETYPSHESMHVRTTIP